MPVFSKNKQHILFIHIPKSAGSTVEFMFRVNKFSMSYHDHGGPNTLNPIRICSPQHMHANMIQSLFKLPEFAYIFTVVRHPVARFKSEFVMRNMQKLAEDKLAVMNETYVEKWFDHFHRQYLNNPFVLDNHLRPQSEFMVPGCKVFRLENGLDTAFIEIQKEVPELENIESKAKKLDSVHLSGVSSSDVPISSGLSDKLSQLYAADFENFGY